MSTSFNPESFQSLSFNSDERSFLESLAEQNKGLDYLLILFGFSDVITVPNADGVADFLAGKVITIPAPNWGDAAQGAANIVAGKASQSVQLFILGKFLPLLGKKPQGKNLPFFKKLAEHYTSLLNP